MHHGGRACSCSCSCSCWGRAFLSSECMTSHTRAFRHPVLIRTGDRTHESPASRCGCMVMAVCGSVESWSACARGGRWSTAPWSRGGGAAEGGVCRLSRASRGAKEIARCFHGTGGSRGAAQHQHGELSALRRREKVISKAVYRLAPGSTAWQQQHPGCTKKSCGQDLADRPRSQRRRWAS